MLRKIALVLVLLAFSYTGMVSARTLNTAGTDYGLYLVNPNETREATWLGNNHDIIIAPNDITTAAAGSTGRQITEDTYDDILTANADAIIATYVPYNTVTATEKAWMESWASTHSTECPNGVEDLYYHYYIDTTITDRNSTEHTILGYGGGTASTLSESRVMSLWLSAAYPNVAPSLSCFRDAYNAFVVQKSVLVGAESDTTKRVPGLLLDTFDGTINDNSLSIYLHNTREIRYAINGDYTSITESQARAYVAPYMISHVKAMTTALEAQSGVDTAYVFPNIAELAQAYYYFEDLWEDVLDSDYNKKYTEYFGKSAVMRYTDLPYLQSTYDDLEDGNIIIGQIEATDTGSDNTKWFQGLVARLYMMAHDNFYAAFHSGTASSYSPIPQNSSGTYEASLWHDNMSLDLGSPQVRSGEDYWGDTNTNKFFILQTETSNWNAVAREFTNGLVVQVFGDSMGISEIGTQVYTVSLGGTYYQIDDENNVSSTPITSIDLGLGEGAILNKGLTASGGQCSGMFNGAF